MVRDGPPTARCINLISKTRRKFLDLRWTQIQAPAGSTCDGREDGMGCLSIRLIPTSGYPRSEFQKWKLGYQYQTRNYTTGRHQPRNARYDTLALHELATRVNFSRSRTGSEPWYQTPESGRNSCRMLSKARLDLQFSAKRPKHGISGLDSELPRYGSHFLQSLKSQRRTRKCFHGSRCFAPFDTFSRTRIFLPWILTGSQY